MKRLDTNRLARPRLCVQSMEPAYGDNYKPGFLGFTQTGSSMLSVGIAHFTRWSRLSDIHISHVLVVTGENECVEAVAGKGIVKSTLDRYFADPKTQIFFRKPRKCTQGLGQRIAETALSQAGTKYDTLVTVAQMLDGSFLRRWMISHFRESPDHFVGHLLNRDNRWIARNRKNDTGDCEMSLLLRMATCRPG